MKKRSPEGEARRIAAIREAYKRPEVIAKRLGRVCSPETRSKIGAANSKALKGRRMTDAQREKMREISLKRWQHLKANPELLAAHKAKVSKALKGKYTGESGANWRGGVTEPRLSHQNKEWRRAVLIKDDFTCQVCLIRGAELHADHIQAWTDYPSLVSRQVMDEPYVVLVTTSSHSNAKCRLILNGEND